MRLYLSGGETLPRLARISGEDLGELVRGRYILVTYANLGSAKPEELEIIAANVKDLMMDSGAFSVNHNKNGSTDDMAFWEQWCDGYVDEVKRLGVTHFFEMDIDDVVPYEDVVRLRERIDERSGMQCIPVWHPQRGLDGWKEMCESRRPVIAIGGVAGNKAMNHTNDLWDKGIPGMVRMAHRSGCKVHLLGSENAEYLKLSCCDSSDASSWVLSAAKFGKLDRMRPDGKMTRVGHGGHGKEAFAVAGIHNFREHCKLQELLDDDE